MQIDFFRLSDDADAMERELHASQDAMERIDTIDLSDLESTVAAVEEWADLADAEPNGYDLAQIREITGRLRHAFDAVQTANEKLLESREDALGAWNEATDRAWGVIAEIQDGEFEAAWAEVDRARSLLTPPFRPALDCPRCHRESIGAATAGLHDHDARCPRRPAPPVKHAPARVDAATGLPPRPQSRSEVFDRLDRLTAAASSPTVAPVIPLRSPSSCTKCRTGRGRRHGKGCAQARGRSA